MSERLSERPPLEERMAEIKKILTLTPRDRVHSAALLVQLGKHMLSEAELACLPEAERLELYQNLQAGIARLKQSLNVPQEGEMPEADEQPQAGETDSRDD